METLLQSLTMHGVTHLLRYGDRNAMRYSIENRVPFLTIPMAEFMLRLPEHYLISETGETKSVFRAAMRGIVPDEILDRRDKVGFDTPMREWMQHRIRADISAFNQKRLSGIGYIFTPEMIKEVTRAFNSNKPFDWQIWRIYNLLAWYDQIHRVNTNRVNP